MSTLVRIQLGPPHCPYGSGVEHSLGKGEVTSSNLVMGFLKELIVNQYKKRLNTRLNYYSFGYLPLPQSFVFL